MIITSQMQTEKHDNPTSSKGMVRTKIWDLCTGIDGYMN